MQATDSATYSGTQTAMPSCTEPRTEPCTQACTQEGMVANMASGMVLPVRDGRCPLGFSRLQIAIIAILKAHQQIIAYWQIAHMVSSCYGFTATEGAVRGALERLYRRGGILMRRRAGSGSLKGNRYAFVTEPCPGILPYDKAQPGTQTSTNFAAQSAKIPPSSIQEEKERKNLSISSSENAQAKLEALTEADMAFHWPKLTASGFGTHQIRQIIQRLEQKGSGLSLVLQGLDHAEWALEHKLMLDREGREIEQPVNWVFTILARQGYYPRPTGFVSAQEQAELDAATEKKQLAAAQEERLRAECAVWIDALSADERNAILGTRSAFPLPPETILRNHFRAEIWPKQRQEGQP